MFSCFQALGMWVSAADGSDRGKSWGSQERRRLTANDLIPKND
ncbi:MAG: hypothetical protein SW833_23730 [Cyanobacteriota bacterium]|nr:hypothetical protein [Cyanobacteriota bacterium]